MVTRRQWLLQLGGGVVLAGWSAADLDADELPPGVYGPSREHLGHALAGQPVAVGGETEPAPPRAAAFQPAFFSGDGYQMIVQLTAVILGEPPETPVVHEIAEWIDLTVFEAAAVRAAARALSPAHRTVAIHYYGAAPVRRLEEFDARQVCRDGLAWLNSESHGRFTALSPGEQLSLVARNAANPFLAYLKERAIHGFYTSRVGLDELGYRGNAFYASPPGCEHLFA